MHLPAMTTQTVKLSSIEARFHDPDRRRLQKQGVNL